MSAMSNVTSVTARSILFSILWVADAGADDAKDVLDAIKKSIDEAQPTTPSQHEEPLCDPVSAVDEICDVDPTACPGLSKPCSRARPTYRHARRAELQFYGGRSTDPGILLSSDVVWAPPEVLSRGVVVVACAGTPPNRHCATIARQRLSYPPEGPAPGIVFHTLEPLAAIEPFPTDSNRWYSEVGTLEEDPELCRFLPAQPIRWEEPAPSWMHTRHNRILFDKFSGFEFAADGGAGPSLDGDGLVLSSGLRAGIWLSWLSRSPGWFGNWWGLDTRARFVTGAMVERIDRVLIGVRPNAYWLRAFRYRDDAMFVEVPFLREFERRSMAPPAYGGTLNQSVRVRRSSLLGLVVPEIGYATVTNDRGSLYLTWGATMAWALTDHFGAELRPEITWIPFVSNPARAAFATLTLGAIVR
jgi:hypothetical protein